jgi:hypothetical protein
VHPESSTCVERVCVRRPGGAIKDADRACRKDSDCAVVVFDFQCMYCARPGDYGNGIAAAANKKRAKSYEAKATAEQIKQCAMAGPCAQTGEMKPRCRRRLCVLDYEPRP